MSDSTKQISPPRREQQIVSVWIAADPHFMDDKDVPEMAVMFFAEEPKLYNGTFWQVSGMNGRWPIENVWRLRAGEIITATIHANDQLSQP